MKTRLSYFLSSKTVALLFAFTLFMFGVFAWGMNEDTVYAADYTTLDETTNEDFAVATYDATTAKNYIGQTAPTAEGYLFAGWFNDAKCEEASVIKNVAGVTGTECYAKFVPEDVLSIKVQVSKGDATTAKNMRFVSSVDTLTYSNVGFRMKYQDDNKDWHYKINQGTIVYERIDSATQGDEYEFSPKVVDTKSEYFITSTWKGENNTGIAPADFDTNYYVRAYWTTFDNVRVYGPTRYVSVNDGVNKNIVNVSVKDTEQKFIGEVPTISYTDSTGTSKGPSAVTLYHDGAYAHMKIDLGAGVDRETALLSATLFAMSNTQGSDEVIYRNLYTSYAGTADTSWYTVYNTANPSETEYVIATNADLYGLSSLALGGNTFSTDQIYLVNDIVANDGTAASTGWTPATGATEYPWTPIKGFAGKFDGQKHTISGISCTTVSGVAGTGLFTDISGVTIQDVSIENSYFHGTTNAGTGALVGKGAGEFSGIRVGEDVHVTNTAGRFGGIIGVISAESTVSCCWNASNMTSNQQFGGGIFGYAGANGLTITLEHCLNTGNLTYTGSSSAYYGGMAGRANSTSTTVTTGMFTVSDCLNVGLITDRTSYTGGIAGFGAPNKNLSVYENTHTAIQYAVDGSTPLGETVLAGGKQTNVNTTTASAVNITGLIGAQALKNTYLDLVLAGKEGGYWAARENNTPMLVNFLTDSDVVVDELPDEETIYISTAAELMEFASKVNSKTLITNAATKVALKNDINLNEGWTASATAPTNVWTPISGFGGQFDGCGYTISGVYVASQASGQTGIGLFTQTNGAVIKNFKLTNSYFMAVNANGTGAIIGYGNGTIENIHANVTFAESGTRGRIGGIVGVANGDLKVTNCWNESDITATGQYCGGIVGRAYSTGYNITIQHCLNTGNLTHTGTQSFSNFGGLIAIANSTTGTTGLLKIIDSLNAGIVKGTARYTGGIVGYAAPAAGLAEITDSYTAIQYDTDGTTELGTSKIAGEKETNATKTNVAAVKISNLYGVRAKVYTTLDFNTYWTTRTGDVPVLTTFKSPGDGVEVEDPTLFLLTNNAGTIKTAEQLISFAELMNTGILKVDANTVVTLANDINLNEGWDASSRTAAPVVWDAIVGYPGIFDGAGYTISGLYTSGQGTGKGIGLFTQTVGATIKNLSITNSYFNVNTTNGSGPVIGLGTGTVQNVYTDVILVNTDAKGRMGGIVGKADGDLRIENCWSASQIEANGIYVGGIIGYSNSCNVTVAHCLNTGALTYTGADNSYYGGIVGSSCSSSDTTAWDTSVLQITDCLNLGTVTDNAYEGGVIGNAGGADANGAATVVITNAYSVDSSSTVVGNDYGASITDCGVVAGDNLLGDLATTNTTLDFNTYWTVRTGDTPVLTTFANK